MYLQAVAELQTTVTPQAIIANTLLQMSAEELEEAVNEALQKNPALEMEPPALCQLCGTPLNHGLCPVCAVQGRNATIRHDEEGWWNDDTRWPGSTVNRDPDEEFDPLSIIAAEVSLTEHLWIQLVPLLSPDEEPVAEAILDALDARGLLSVPLETLAAQCQRSASDVERVLAKVQSLEPPGIAARSIQECLLIQLRHLSEQGSCRELELAYRLISECWEELMRMSVENIARRLKIGEEEVHELVQFIKQNLNPFPANTNWAGPGPRRSTPVARPDIIIRRKRPPETGYEIEVPDSRRYRLRVNSVYQELARGSRSGRDALTYSERAHIREQLAQARLFINCVRQRWQTLERMALALVDIQEEFLEKGYRYLKPLTRAQLAEIVGVHESTVGRAVANKTVMLPSGHIVPFSDFFDGSLAAKCLIEEIIAAEQEPLSDQRVAELLREHGLDIARRTVAKYRDALGIPPARVRGILKQRCWRALWVPPERAVS